MLNEHLAIVRITVINIRGQCPLVVTSRPLEAKPLAGWLCDFVA